jgi:hypothetical protein
VCEERVARHLAFCPTPAPATIRYGVSLLRGDHGFVAVLISIARAKGVSARAATLFAQGLQTRSPLELDLGDRIGSL